MSHLKPKRQCQGTNEQECTKMVPATRKRCAVCAIEQTKILQRTRVVRSTRNASR